MALFLKSRKKPEEELPESTDSTVLVAGSSSAASRNSQNIPLLVGREYKSRVARRGFVVTTIVLVVLVLIGAFVPTLIEIISSNFQTKLVIVNEAGPVAGQDPVAYLDSRLNIVYDSKGNPKPASANKKPPFDLKSAPASDLANQRKLVSDGKQDNLLVLGRDQNGDLTFNLFTTSSANGSDTVRLRSVANEMNFVDRLARLGIAPAQMGNLFSPATFTAVSTADKKNGRSPAESGAAYILVTAGIILIFSTVLQYGASVAQGAVEEKSNRVMEIMVNAATPFQLMIGKIVGIGLAGMTQIGIMVTFGVAAFLAQQPIKDALLGDNGSGTKIDITSLSLGLLGLIAVYFVLGFFLYAGLFAAIGSLLSRPEDVQSAVTPLTFLFMAGYIVSFFAINVPDATWVAVAAYFPFFTPVMMLTRAGLGTLAWWEVPLSILIMLVAIVLCTWVAARIYRAGVLMYGQRFSLGKLFKLARAR